MSFFAVNVLVVLMRKKTTSFFNVGGNVSFYRYSYRCENGYSSLFVVAMVLSFEVFFTKFVFKFDCFVVAMVFAFNCLSLRSCGFGSLLTPLFSPESSG